MSKVSSISKTFIALTIVVIIVIAGLSPGLSLAANSELTDDSCEAIKAIGGECGSSEGAVGNLLQTIVNALLFLVGAISVIMIIIGGIRFVISRGDPQAAATARNTVMYAVVGLVVAVLAWAIIHFVLGTLSGADTTTSPTTPIESSEQTPL